MHPNLIGFTLLNEKLLIINMIKVTKVLVMEIQEFYILSLVISITDITLNSPLTLQFAI